MITILPEIEELISELVSFVKSNRRISKNPIFKGWKDEDIERTIRFSLLDVSLLYHRNDSGSIDGLLNGFADRERKQFYIEHILIINKGLFPFFIKQMENMFKGYTFIAHRYGKMKTYNTERFLKKLH